MQQMRIGSGQTSPETTPWTQYGANGLTVTIDTTQGDFSAVPIYTSAIGGDTGHWDMVGASSIYHPAVKSFTIYIHSFDNRPLTPAIAKASRWHVNWIGVQLFPG
jgi:hypothetical protein